MLRWNFSQQRLVAIAMIVIGGLALAACGSSSAPTLTPAQQLTQTFKASSHIVSGDIALSVDLKLNGIKQLKGKPIAITVTGPFEKSVGADLKITVSAVGATGDLGLDIVNKKLYVGLANIFYSLPTSALKSALGSSGITAIGSAKIPTTTASASAELAKLGIDPRTWITGWRDLGATSVGGVSSEHLQGQLDVAKILGDLETAASKSGATSSSGSSDADGLAMIESAITTSHVDLYIGVSDHIIRGADFDLAFTVPALIKAEVGGLTSGSLTANLVLTGVNAPQKVVAPANPKPVSGILTGVAALEKQLRPALKLLASEITPSVSSSFSDSQAPTASTTLPSESPLEADEYTAFLAAKAATITNSSANHLNTAYDTGAKLVADITAAEPELKAVVNDDPLGSEPIGTFTVAGTTATAFEAVGKVSSGDTVTYSVNAHGIPSSSASGSFNVTSSKGI
jgi:hypothetical protein